MLATIVLNLQKTIIRLFQTIQVKISISKLPMTITVQFIFRLEQQAFLKQFFTSTWHLHRLQKWNRSITQLAVKITSFVFHLFIILEQNSTGWDQWLPEVKQFFLREQ